MDCPAPLLCFTCQKPGHTSAACPERSRLHELQLFGHGLPDQVFFYMEMGEAADAVAAPTALVKVLKDSATAAIIEAELMHFIKKDWDWGVKRIFDTEFVVTFPSDEWRHICTKSTMITLALNDLPVKISIPKTDPSAVAVLQTTWVQIWGLPEEARYETMIRNMSRFLGKVVVVDELSLIKGDYVCAKVKCLNPAKLQGVVMVFFNDVGYNLMRTSIP